MIHYFLHTDSLKYGEFTLKACLNSVIKFSLGIFDLYLDFIKFIGEQVDPHTQDFLNILRSFPRTSS